MVVVITMASTNFSLNETSLDLFQKPTDATIHPGLQKGMQIINSMIELEYMTSELNFTTAGIDYMFRLHREFIKNIDGKDIDFSLWPAAYQLKEEAKKRGLNVTLVTEQFKYDNAKYDLGENEVNYNDMKFKKKAPGAEPMG